MLGDLEHLSPVIIPLTEAVLFVGCNPNFIAGSTEALSALMQLHPLKIGKPQKVQANEVVAGPADPAASISSLRKAAVPPAAYDDILKHQVTAFSGPMFLDYLDTVPQSHAVTATLAFVQKSQDLPV